MLEKIEIDYRALIDTNDSNKNVVKVVGVVKVVLSF